MSISASAPLDSDPSALATSNGTDAGWGDVAEGMALVTSIMRVQQLLLGRVESTLRPFELTFARFEVLMLLSFSSRGVLPVGKIGERLQVHPASVTNAVQRLVAAGLAERSTNPADRRSVLASITPAGRRVALAAAAALNEQVFADVGLDRAEHPATLQVLATWRQAFGDFH
jgi:DNA-binding MarR family transcriptional regulator